MFQNLRTLDFNIYSLGPKECLRELCGRVSVEIVRALNLESHLKGDTLAKCRQNVREKNGSRWRSTGGVGIIQNETKCYVQLFQ